MSYSKTTWANDSTPAINATNLNKMEQGIYEAHEALEDKVDKVNGKGLSTNDYTDAEKTKLDSVESGAQVNTVNSVNGMTGDVTFDKSDLGLENVDNTSDADKPISTATQSALDTIDNNLESTKSIAQSHLIRIEDAAPINAEELRIRYCATQYNNTLDPISPSNPCPIVGYKSIPIFHSGKNLLDPEFRDKDNFQYNGDGFYPTYSTGSLSELNLRVYQRSKSIFHPPLVSQTLNEVGVYTFPITVGWSESSLYITHALDGGGEMLIGDFPLMTTNDDDTNFVLTVEIVSVNPNYFKFRIQLEEGTTATPFEPFKGGVQYINHDMYTSDYVYIGEVDVNSGKKYSAEVHRTFFSNSTYELINSTSICDFFKITDITPGIPGGYIICNVFKGEWRSYDRAYVAYLDEDGYPVLSLPVGEYTTSTIGQYLDSINTDLLYEKEIETYGIDSFKPSRLKLFEGLNYIRSDILAWEYKANQGRKIVSFKYQPNNIIGVLKDSDQKFADFLERLGIDKGAKLQPNILTAYGVKFQGRIRRVNGIIKLEAKIDPTSIATQTGIYNFEDFTKFRISDYLCPLDTTQLEFNHSSGTGKIYIKFRLYHGEQLMLSMQVYRVNTEQGEWILNTNYDSMTKDISPAYDLYSGEEYHYDYDS